MTQNAEILFEGKTIKTKAKLLIDDDATGALNESDELKVRDAGLEDVKKWLAVQGLTITELIKEPVVDKTYAELKTALDELTKSHTELTSEMDMIRSHSGALLLQILGGHEYHSNGGVCAAVFKMAQQEVAKVVYERVEAKKSLGRSRADVAMLIKQFPNEDWNQKPIDPGNIHTIMTWFYPLTNLVGRVINNWSPRGVSELKDMVRHINGNKNRIDQTAEDDPPLCVVCKKRRVTPGMATCLHVNCQILPAEDSGQEPKDPLKEAVFTVAEVKQHTCKRCKDTHSMIVTLPDGESTRRMNCTECPIPCALCSNGSYCKKIPCMCECHKHAAGVAWWVNGKDRNKLMYLGEEVAEFKTADAGQFCRLAVQQLNEVFFNRCRPRVWVGETPSKGPLLFKHPIEVSEWLNVLPDGMEVTVKSFLLEKIEKKMGGPAIKK